MRSAFFCGHFSCFRALFFLLFGHRRTINVWDLKRRRRDNIGCGVREREPQVYISPLLVAFNVWCLGTVVSK